MKVELNRKVKYKGEYYKANTPFDISDEDIEAFNLMGAIVHEYPKEDPLDLYLEAPKDKLKDLVNLVDDVVLLQQIIENDKRKSTKEIYTKRLEELLKAKEGEEDVN